MNLADGRIIDSRECGIILDDLENRITKTLSGRRLDPFKVVEACDRLVNSLDEAMYLEVMSGLGIDEILGRKYIDEARKMFCGESLKTRLKIELGENYGKTVTYTPLFPEHEVTEQILPLGVLLHVAAGNADGLPAFSVLEGLLTGNINILKLPAEEGGVTVSLLMELIKIEPSLAEYIYVFNYSSKDIINIKKLVSASDAIVVWGGDEAVSALRLLAKPNMKIIEWGHKISFAYVTMGKMSDVKNNGTDLVKLAENIVETGQILCSSCQGIFIDTEEMDVVYNFCRDFLNILESVYNRISPDVGISIKLKTALQVYTEELDETYKESKVFKGDNCSLIAYGNSILEPAIQFGNAWVKPLPRTKLIETLRPYKNYLQTVGLICDPWEKSELYDIFGKTGIVHICPGDRMSATYCGAAHDGEYPLRRYTKIVSYE